MAAKASILRTLCSAAPLQRHAVIGCQLQLIMYVTVTTNGQLLPSQYISRHVNSIS
jgi:hypothetical protein